MLKLRVPVINALGALRWAMFCGLSVGLSLAVTPSPGEGRQQRDELVVPDTLEFLFQLENGLPGILVSDPSTERVTFSVFVRAGWGDDEQQGIAEMVATMIRRGPCWMGPRGFDDALREIDAEIFVEMTPDLTEISFSAPPAEQFQALRLFSGAIRAPCLDRAALEEFQTSGVFGGSFRLLDDSTLALERAPAGPLGLEWLMQEFLFRDHDYNSVVSAQDAAELSLEEINEFARDFVQPTNLVLAVSGPDDATDLLFQVVQMFSDWEPKGVPALRRGSDLQTRPANTYFIETEGQVEGAYVLMGQELPRIDIEDRPTFEVLSSIFASKVATRVAGRARVDVRPFLNIRGPGIMMVRAWVEQPQNVAAITDEILAVMNVLRDSTVDEAFLQDVRTSLGEQQFSSRFNGGEKAARTFASEYAKWGMFRHLFLYAGWIEDVSVQDVRRAAARYLAPDRVTVFVVDPDTRSQ